MKYYIVQTEAQGQATDFDIIKVKDIDETKFLETLKDGMKVMVKADSLMDAIINLQKTIASQL